jgi:hypothetical protein
VLTHVPSQTVMQSPSSAWSMELPVALSVAPLPRLAFDLLLLPGAAAPSVEYRGLWDRGVMRLGLALGLRGFWGAP